MTKIQSFDSTNTATGSSGTALSKNKLSRSSSSRPHHHDEPAPSASSFAQLKTRAARNHPDSAVKTSDAGKDTAKQAKALNASLPVKPENLKNQPGTGKELENESSRDLSLTDAGLALRPANVFAPVAAQGEQGADQNSTSQNGSHDAYCQQTMEKAPEVVQAMSENTVNIDSLEQYLLPLSGDNGIFEVQMPDGETMGVVVDVQETQVRFLISPSSKSLADRLRDQQTDMEDKLERRIGKNKTVKIAVL